jgi:hypothetical protein|tara:strand:- start:194 stop:610 length:417 start_codon:yes stop_codon:yes gene_type:complete
MTTFYNENAIPAGTLHKRQGGLWGQFFANPQIEAKLARVEPLFKELHGRNLNRTAFFKKCHEIAVEGKSDVGGYLQYMVCDVGGIMLGEMHRELGKEVRRNRLIKKDKNKRNGVIIEVGGIDIKSWNLAKKAGGRKAA